MQTPTALTRDQLLSVFQSAKNRLEYLTANDWALIIDRAKHLTFEKNDSLIHHGKQAKIVFLLGKGTARVETEAKSKISQIGPGEICGEMSFLEGSYPSASVIANETIEAYAIDWPDLQELFELFPHLASRFYRSLAVSLSKRLRGQIVAQKR